MQPQIEKNLYFNLFILQIITAETAQVELKVAQFPVYQDGDCAGAKVRAQRSGTEKK